jgi:prepilin-type N-terminal cleavage/methylation domain-containing protein
MRRTESQAGFSLPELLIAMTIMLLISGAAVSALLKMTSTQATVWNRTQMHSGIRGATEVLQQEVGQAGRISLGATNPTLTGASAAGASAGAAVTLTVSSTAGMFVNEILALDTGDKQENVKITVIGSATSVTVVPFASNATLVAHAINVPIQVMGAFSAGIVPPAVTNGSTASVLKLFGDINSDGSMVYIEYTCDTSSGNLYRNVMAWDAASSPAATQSQILLSNVRANPNGTACFTYQTQTVGGTPFVTDVAITLTVETQVIDPVTKQKQTETKALLNVSPRNVFNAWQLASLGITERIQPTPASITTLLQ